MTCVWTVDGQSMDEEMSQVCYHLDTAVRLRDKYLYHIASPPLPRKITGPVTFDPATVEVTGPSAV
jgi:hypothetical protein